MIGWFIFRTKQLLVDVIQCVDGDSIQSLCSGATSPNQEMKYRSIIQSRTQQEKEAKLNHTTLNRTNSFLSDTR